MSNVPGRLLRVALTGGIATGKSHCLRRFAGHGVPVIDADVLAREAVQLSLIHISEPTRQY